MQFGFLLLLFFGCRVEQGAAGHSNDVRIAGFSDQILKFVAERGSASQLAYVDNMDAVFKLKPLPDHALKEEATRKAKATGVMKKAEPERPLPVAVVTPTWQTVRVFISSTFVDMHSERDLLARFVFPELRSRAAKHFVNVHEVDLRWGLTEEDTRSRR